MSDYLLNGYIYHETNSDEAKAAIAEAEALGGNLSTTVDGLPAWVFDGVCMVKGEPVPGHVPIDWNAVQEMCGSGDGSVCSGMGDSAEDYFYDH